jgi:hypothetical protein
MGWHRVAGGGHVCVSHHSQNAALVPFSTGPLGFPTRVPALLGVLACVRLPPIHTSTKRVGPCPSRIKAKQEDEVVVVLAILRDQSLM